MTRALSWRATRMLLIGLPVVTSCSAPSSGGPPADGLTIVEHPVATWEKPCTVPAGTTFAVKLDRRLGTGTSTAGEIFTAQVSRGISSCGRDVIVKGASLRGRVVDVARGDRSRLALELLDVETVLGPQPVPMAIRSAGGHAMSEEERPFRASVLYGPQARREWAPEPSAPATPQPDVELPAASELVVEVSKPVTILP